MEESVPRLCQGNLSDASTMAIYLQASVQKQHEIAGSSSQLGSERSVGCLKKSADGQTVMEAVKEDDEEERLRLTSELQEIERERSASCVRIVRSL